MRYLPSRSGELSGDYVISWRSSIASESQANQRLRLTYREKLNVLSRHLDGRADDSRGNHESFVHPDTSCRTLTGLTGRKNQRRSEKSDARFEQASSAGMRQVIVLAEFTI
jgi:hypothetical protein